MAAGSESTKEKVSTGRIERAPLIASKRIIVETTGEEQQSLLVQSATVNPFTDEISRVVSVEIDTGPIIPVNPNTLANLLKILDEIGEWSKLDGFVPPAEVRRQLVFLCSDNGGTSRIRLKPNNKDQDKY